MSFSNDGLDERLLKVERNVLWTVKMVYKCNWHFQFAFLMYWENILIKVGNKVGRTFVNILLRDMKAT